MRRQSLSWILSTTLLMGTVSTAQLMTRLPSRQSGASQHSRSASAYGQLPLSFEANQGQTNSQAKFVTRGRGYSAFLTSGGMVLSLHPSKTPKAARIAQTTAVQRSKSNTTLRFNLLGAAQNPAVVGEDQQPGIVNYFIGKDPKRWRTNIPTYAKVRYKNVYPGIDLVYYGNHRQLEYDFEIAQGADPNRIQFEIKGANHVHLDEKGDLVLTVNGGELHFKSPVVYEQKNGRRSILDGGYIAKDATHVAFRIAHYDSNQPLVIDPVLVYSTYLGGSGDDEPRAIAVDGNGSIYVVGDTDSSDFPGTTAGTLDFGLSHVFVAKLDATASHIEYADYLGGDSGEWGAALALNSANEVYLTGTTMSDDFPTVNPYQILLTGVRNGFLSKISADGKTLQYSTYLGGSNWDEPTSLALDTLGDVLVAGMTSSQDFPLSNAFQSVMAANGGGVFGNYGFLTEFSPDGSTLNYSTYLGGSSMVVQNCSDGPCWLPPYSRIAGVAVDTTGNAYVAGYTNTYNFPTTTGAYQVTDTAPQNAPVGFVGKFNPAGGLAYSTYLYGTSGAQTLIAAIAVDNSGSAYVTGSAISDGTFPVTSTSICDPDPGKDGAACSYAFVTKLNPAGSGLAYSTFLGANNNATPQALVLDGNHNAYVLGMVFGCNTFVAVNPIEGESCADIATSDLLLVEIDATASTELFATFLGGTDDEYPTGLAVDATGNIYVGGETYSDDFPTTPGVLQDTLNGTSNSFLLKIGPDPAPAFSASPSLLEYSSQSIGSTSPAATTILRNMGSTPLSISSLTVNGDFTQTNDCGNTVPAAGSCTFSVSFTPSAPGARPGSIVIEDDATGSPHTVTLNGYAPGAIAALNPSSLIFPSQTLETQGTTQLVTLTNNGDMDLTIGSIETTGDFAQTNNCATTVASGFSCVIHVTFTPTASGTRNGTLVVTDGAQLSQTLSLSGVGIDFSLATSTSSQIVLSGTTATYPLSVTPLGGSFTNSVKLTCSGLPAFSTCTFSPGTITPGGNKAITNLRIATTATLSGTQMPSFKDSSLYAIWIPLQGFGLVGIMLAGFRGPSKKLRHFYLMGLVFVALVFTTACAGVSKPAQTLGTAAPGTYDITVTASSGTLQHAVNLTLTIQ